VAFKEVIPSNAVLRCQSNLYIHGSEREWIQWEVSRPLRHPGVDCKANVGGCLCFFHPTGKFGYARVADELGHRSWTIPNMP
jgi:hypothetical protein